MSATPPPIYDPRSTPSTTLKPYLELPHLISLTWLAYPILSLLFVAFRLQLSSDSASDAVASAKNDLLASCKAAEQAATAAVSMPRYMAAATNAQITDAVNGTMNGAREALILALTVMEAIINFIVDTYRSTFLCFLELVVRGALSLLIGAVQEINSFLTSTFNTIRTGIQNDVAAANKVIQGAISAVNKINPFGNISVPSIDIPSLSALQNVTLPSDIEDGLVKLNSSLPSLSDLKSKLDDIIDTPFELVKKDINETFAGLSFDVNALPVPQQNTVQFCDQMDTSVVDDLGRDLVKIAKIGIIILIIAAFLLIAAHAALEWYKWRCQTRHMQLIREAWTTDPSLYRVENKSSKAPVVELSDHNLLMLHGSMLHPLLTKIANRISAFLRLSPSKHVNLSWFFHYVFHPPAFACFLIGFVGLLSVELQMLAVQPLAHKYSEQAVAATNDFATTIATSVNSSMYNQSSTYANDINSRVDHVQSSVNDGLFGWVNSTTTTLNDTINAFYDDLQDAVNTVFNGTVLESPIEEFIRCFIGSKVDAIEKALTFLHDNLNINIPRVNESVLVLSPQDVDEATRPIATAAIGGGDGDDQGVVGKLVNAYITSLKTERIMFSIFLALWLFVVLMALSIIFWHSYLRPWRDERRRRRWRKQNRAGVESIIVPFRQQNPGNRFNDSDKPHVHVNVIPARNDAILIPDPRSLGNPAYGQSWDSIIDNMPHADQGSSSNRNISPPRRLMPFGGSNKDGDNAPGHADVSPNTIPTWMKPFSLAFWRTRNERPPVDLGSSDGSPRPRPHLTITTAHGRTAPLTEDANPPPASAWSVSPHKSSWPHNIVPTKMPAMPAIRPKHRRTATAPPEVTSPVREAASNPAPIESAFAMPLHHSYGASERPAPRPPAPPPTMQLPGYPSYANQHLLPPPMKPTTRRTMTDPNTMPPPGLSQPKPARHASQIVNPFATPFDDEYQEARRSSARKSSPTDPFAGFAI